MPTEELEHELRSAFAKAAAAYQNPGQACRRVLQHNYRPGGGHRGLAAGITAAASAAVVLGLGLSGAFGSAPARDTGTIRTTAFTLTRNANGTDTLTIKPEVLFDPSTLQNDLAQYGIPAKVTVGGFCSSDPAPGGFSQVVSLPQPIVGDGGYRYVQAPAVTINPAAMPAGTELSVGAFPAAVYQQTALVYRPTALALIDTNSYTCTSTVPTTAPPGGVLLYNATGQPAPSPSPSS